MKNDLIGQNLCFCALFVILYAVPELYIWCRICIIDARFISGAEII